MSTTLKIKYQQNDKVKCLLKYMITLSDRDRCIQKFSCNVSALKSLGILYELRPTLVIGLLHKSIVLALSDKKKKSTRQKDILMRARTMRDINKNKNKSGVTRTENTEIHRQHGRPTYRPKRKKIMQ